MKEKKGKFNIKQEPFKVHVSACGTLKTSFCGMYRIMDNGCDKNFAIHSLI